MSFGMNDRNWIDPPEDPKYVATCGDCTHCHVCPCGKWGWCDDAEDFIEVGIVRDMNSFCTVFDPNDNFNPNWVQEQAGEMLCDWKREEER